MDLYCTAEEMKLIEAKKKEFIQFMINQGIRYNVCGTMSAAMNEVIAEVKQQNNLG